MMILARPSISTYHSRSLYELGVPVVLTEPTAAEKAAAAYLPPLLTMKPAVKLLDAATLGHDPKLAYRARILTSSENALAYLYGLIPHDDRVMKARLFKDKAVFRRAIARRFPQFFFREFPSLTLDQVDASGFPFPVILKPTVGISSIGVIRVASFADWPRAVAFLQKDLREYRQNYSNHVVEDQNVIIERYIEGRELAIDGYFGDDAEPVVLNILEHLFLDANDTSDRVYLTRKSLVQKFLEPVTQFLREFGDIFDLKRFPFHLEIRVSPEGEFIPIELNPLRFSGLGTTEIAQYAYGINVYKAFFREEKPDWAQILNREDDSIYSFMCADIPTELFRKPGLVISDRAFYKEFSEVLEYRLLDERETSTYAVIFFRSESLAECERFLAMDFSKFMRLA